jgi:hypothetical protein
MPQKLSSFIGSSKIATSNITLNLNNYGSIDTNETHTAAVNNAAVFRKAYEDYLNYKFSYNDTVNCYIDCPPGDYYFGDNPSGDFNFYPITLDPPQGSTITIRSTVGLNWANRPSTSSLNSASTPEARYALMKDYYQTRFHFARNGILGKVSGSAGTKTNIQNIGIFGRYDGSPGTFNKATNIWGRGLSGGLSVSKCGVQGFGAIDGTYQANIAGTTAASGWGVAAENGSGFFIGSIQIVDCLRAMLTQYNGTIFSFGDIDLIHNKDHGATASFGGSILLGGEGRVYISNFETYGAHAYAGGIIHFGFTTGTHQVIGGLKSIRVAEKGLITGQSGKVSYSSSQVLTDGLINFY